MGDYLNLGGKEASSRLIAPHLPLLTEKMAESKTILNIFEDDRTGSTFFILDFFFFGERPD